MAMATADRSFQRAPAVSEGPIMPREAAILASTTVAREIELSSLLVEDVKIGKPLSMHVHFRMSKNDSLAAGVTIRFPCVCSKSLSVACPACTGKYYLENLAKQGDTSKYLFHQENGEPCTKEGWAKTFEALSAHLPPSEHFKNWTGHTPRVTGARYYARKGFRVESVMYYGRWKSEKIARWYIGNAVAEIQPGSVFHRTEQEDPTEQWRTQETRGDFILSLRSTIVHVKLGPKSGVAKCKKTLKGYVDLEYITSEQRCAKCFFVGR